MSDASVLQIVILHDGNLVGTEVFLPGDYTVGRDPASELVLQDPGVSSFHAHLTFRDGRVFLKDTGSGPVFLNGQRTRDAEVHTIDDVAIGPYLLKFRINKKKGDGAKAPDATRKVPTGGPGPAPQVKDLLRDEPEVPEDQATVRVDLPKGLLGAAAPKAVGPPSVPPRPAPRQVLAAPVPAVHPSPVPVVVPSRPAVVPRPPRADLTEPEGRPAYGAPPRPVPNEEASARFRSKPAPQPSDAAARHKSRQKAGASPGPIVGPVGPLTDEPILRVRVFWGRSAVGLHGFPFDTKVVAAPRETAQVPLYHFRLPKDRFQVARWASGGWEVRVPPGAAAYSLESGSWRSVVDKAEGEVTTLPLPVGKVIRMADGQVSVEFVADRVLSTPPPKLRDSVDPAIGVPLLIAVGLVTTMLVAMPRISKEEMNDFDAKVLAPVRAKLEPPEKKEKKKEEKKKVELTEKEVKKEVKKKEDVPKQVAQTTKAVDKVVKKVTTSIAVDNILKATAKIGGGPKGFGGPGMGTKLSPLIGKPAIAMAGMTPGMGPGGFGTMTKGFGALRGYPGGAGGGPGVFAAGGIGKRNVSGTVVQAPTRSITSKGGSLDRELIAKVINEHLNEVRACYEKALLRDAALNGKLVVEWTISLDGDVTEVKQKSSTLRGPEVPNCVIAALTRWKFPRPKGGMVVVSYPFLFNSVGF